MAAAAAWAPAEGGRGDPHRSPAAPEHPPAREGEDPGAEAELRFVGFAEASVQQGGR